MAPPGRLVVRRHDRRQLVAGLLQRRLGEARRRVGAPVVGPGLVDDLHRPALDRGAEHLELPLTNRLGVGIRRRPANQQVVAFLRPLQQIARLKLTHLDRIEGHVEVDVGVAHQPVVADDRHFLRLGLLDDLGRRLGVVGNQDQHLDALAEQLVGKLRLFDPIAIGGLDEDVRFAILRPLDEQIAVPQPSFVLACPSGTQSAGRAASPDARLFPARRPAARDRDHGGQLPPSTSSPCVPYHPLL